jgi:hypothetical protein
VSGARDEKPCPDCDGTGQHISPEDLAEQDAERVAPLLPAHLWPLLRRWQDGEDAEVIEPVGDWLDEHGDVGEKADLPTDELESDYWGAFWDALMDHDPETIEAEQRRAARDAEAVRADRENTDRRNNR